MANVRPKETVKFSWKTISTWGFINSLSAFAHSNLFINPSQDFIFSSVSVVTFSGLKNGEFSKFLEMILEERYGDS